MKNKTIKFFCIMTIFVFGLSILPFNVKGSIVGNYYVQTFNGYVDGSYEIPFIDNGITWGNYHPVTDSHITSNRIMTHQSAGSCYINFTLSSSSVEFDLIHVYAGLNTWEEFVVTGFNSANVRNFKISHRNTVGVNCVNVLYGKTDATVIKSSTTSISNNSGHLIFTFNDNNTITFGSTGVMKSINGTINVLSTDYDKVPHINFYAGILGTGSNTILLDNIYYLPRGLYPWEIITDYTKGSVLHSLSSNYTTTLTPTQTFQIVEKNPSFSSGSIDIEQLTFNVATTTELSKLDITLHINSIDLGYYTTYYYYTGGSGINPMYILTWKNINEIFDSTDLIIEFLISAKTTNAIFSYPVYNGDIDNDSIINFKTSTGLTSLVLPYFDGSYNGITNYNSVEPIYKIWYYSEYGISNAITINLFDGETNTLIDGYLGSCFMGPPANNTYSITLKSDLWTGDYCLGVGLFDSPFDLNISFVDGSSHWLNVSLFKNYHGPYYQNYSHLFTWYSGYTYNIVMYPTSYSLWENENIFTDGNGLKFGIRTDKTTYKYQEQIRIQYKIPTAQELTSHGYSLSSFHIKGYNQSFISNNIYFFNCNIFNDAWTDAPSFTAVKPPTGMTRMGFELYRNWWWFIDTNRAIVYVNIYDYVTSFVPHGNITSVNPVSPVIGEEVTVTYNANNNGRIQITNLGNHALIYNQTFLKPVGNGFIYYTFSNVGYYRVDLFVYTGVTEHLNDTYYLWVNGSGTEYEDWGYNTEYLTVVDDKLISGYDYLTILYKSKINDTEIRVKSPSGSYMPFGTTVSNKTSGTYKVKLPDWVRIGEYNVTMNTTHGVLYEIFHVVADEYNYAEFSMNSYVINSTVSFYIRHNVRCKVIILKDGIPYGQDYYFDNNTISEGYFTLPDNSFFTVGIWTLELWETNNQIPRKLKSSDTALFYVVKTDIKKIDTSILNTISFIFDAPLCYFIGVAIIVLLTISPLLLGFVVGGRLDLSSIPQFLYLVLAIVGFVLDILLGFFPAWSIFILIVICAMIIIIMWLKNKQG